MKTLGEETYLYALKVASSITTIEGIGQVKIYRRRGLKNIRITIEHDGKIRLSIPWYVPKSAGIRYLLSMKKWIKTHQVIRPASWKTGQKLTNEHRLVIKPAERQNSKAVADESTLTIYLPTRRNDQQKQKSIDGQVVLFLKKEAEKHILPLVESVAKKGGYEPEEVKVKRMKSRWGSCNQDKVITLNLSLVRLPRALTEYVIYHELAHTKHMNHSKDFWKEVENSLPEYKKRRKELKRFNPAIFS